MSDLHDQMYPLISGGRAMWGYRHGWRWMPYWAGKVLARLWNPAACRVLGHLWISEEMARPNGWMACSYCCRRRRMTTGERDEWEQFAAEMHALHRTRLAEEGS